MSIEAESIFQSRLIKNGINCEFLYPANTWRFASDTDEFLIKSTQLFI